MLHVDSFGRLVYPHTFSIFVRGTTPSKERSIFFSQKVATRWIGGVVKFKGGKLIMEITELTDGIKRLYMDDMDFGLLKGIPGQDKRPLLKIYLNNEYKLGIKEILDIVMCETRFGRYVYYRG